MTDISRNGRRGGPRRKLPPLTEEKLRELALAYVARFSTSAGRLSAFCKRKLRERGYEGAEEGVRPPDIDALVARFVAQGFVDDAGFAQAKTGSLLRRGYGKRRIGEALRGDGIAEDLRERTSPGEMSLREAAAAYARRRRLGPFARALIPPGDRATYEKQLAALLRAGHDTGHARHVLAATSPEAVEEWIAEAAEEEDHGR